MDSQSLLAEYVKTGSDAAFRELVERYLDLVYSAAFRLMDRDAHLAEDVAQTVFADLARKARGMSDQVMLGGWLHRHTCYVAATLRRRERRRLNRERLAVQMNSLTDHSEANLAQLGPVLDDAIDQLGADDRRAVLLRFFEQRDFRSIGEALGSNEDAAQKRVSRALEKLHSLLKRRGVVFSATALAPALAVTAVTAAPPGLALSISTSALTSAAAAGSALTLIQIITMTKLKAGIIAALAVAAVATTVVVQHQSRPRESSELTQQLNGLAAENERLSNQLAQANQARELADANSHSMADTAAEARRQAERSAAAAKAQNSSGTNASLLDSMTGNEEMRKVIRDQQRSVMGVLYRSFATNLNLPTEKSDKFTDLLADDIMDNIDLITRVLREKKSLEEMNQAFTQQEAVLQAKVKAELGDEGYAQYQEYTQNLLTSVTTDQFKGMLAKDYPMSDEQAGLFSKALREETQSALARAGLPSDYQMIPTLNFRNIASEEFMNQNLNLLDEVYQRTAVQAAAFLQPEAVAKFGEFRTKAVNNNRMALELNRKMMAPH